MLCASCSRPRDDLAISDDIMTRTVGTGTRPRDSARKSSVFAFDLEVKLNTEKKPYHDEVNDVSF